MLAVGAATAAAAGRAAAADDHGGRRSCADQLGGPDLRGLEGPGAAGDQRQQRVGKLYLVLLPPDTPAPTSGAAKAAASGK